MDHIPFAYRASMPGVYNPGRDVDSFEVDGFAGLDGIGKKLKKKLKRAAAPIKKIGQKIAKVDPVLRTVKKFAQPTLRKGLREGSRIGKQKPFRLAAAALMPIVAAPGLLDSGFRRDTAPVYAAYGVAAGAAGAGFAAGAGADQLLQAGTDMAQQFTGGGAQEPQEQEQEMPPIEVIATQEPESKPFAPLAFVGVALSALSALR